MTPQGPTRRDILQQRNAQLRYLNQLQADGVDDPGSNFKFLEPSHADQMLDEVINRIRGLTEISFATGQQATDAAQEWLHKHPGPIVCFIRNTGILAGDSSKYTENFVPFIALLNSHMLLATSTLGSGFRCLYCEGRYHAVIW